MKPSLPARLPDALVLFAPLALVLALRAVGGPATPAQSVAASPQSEAVNPNLLMNPAEVIPPQYQQWAERRVPEAVTSPMVQASLPKPPPQVVPAPAPAPAPAPVADPDPVDSLPLPRLSVVMGGDRDTGVAMAVLDGTLMRVGDRLPSGWTVHRIDPTAALVVLVNDRGNEVIVRRGR